VHRHKQSAVRKRAINASKVYKEAVVCPQFTLRSTAASASTDSHPCSPWNACIAWHLNCGHCTPTATATAPPSLLLPPAIAKHTQMSPVPQTPETPSADNRPVRGARSCTLCRQMKARCNATEQYPHPCSRCAHLGKAPCVIEPSFRRVNKRAYFRSWVTLTVQANCRDPKRTRRA
jgi:hypothetical protein